MSKNFSFLDTHPVDRTALKAVPAPLAHHYRIFPLGWIDGALKIATDRPKDLSFLDELRVVLDLTKDPVPQEESIEAIEQTLKAHYGVGADTMDKLSEMDNSAEEVSPGKNTNDLEGQQEASVMKFVNQILTEAWTLGATDIHFEPYGRDLQVRYRVDGVLYHGKLAANPKPFQSALISRIKIMAHLSISEKRLPQDGRIKISLKGQEMDLRVSTLPTPHGESINIRLLTRSQFLTLENLGFAKEDLKKIEAQIQKPHGIIFLTGPTGSGKTTTLYSFLKQINTPDRKIITIEDPIEYQMDGITQIQVHPKVGLTFAQGLRSMLRHDPDVMMVGEVRDFETAEIAIRVALTGHLVFSTLHTNDATGAATRLCDIGVEPYLISSSVLCVIAQRLVRLNCPHCFQLEKPTLDMRKKFSLGHKVSARSMGRGRGCRECRQTGFRGRTAIYEILPITDRIRPFIFDRAPAHVVRRTAMDEGMIPLRQKGWEKIEAGLTTPEEVLRVTLAEENR